jgi:hypothetical protein
VLWAGDGPALDHSLDKGMHGRAHSGSIILDPLGFGFSYPIDPLYEL